MAGGRFGSKSREQTPGGKTSEPSPAAPRRKPHRAHQDNLAAQSRRTNRPGRDLEGEADEAARRLVRGERARVGGSAPAAPSLLPVEGGHPLPPESRRIAEQGLGIDGGSVNVHDDRESQLLASAAGARALTDGSNIWLGPGESELDAGLMAHELAHVAQGVPGLQLRSATFLERRAWLSFFDHYLPRKFLNNYMDDTGAAITLSEQEMADVNPIVNIRRSANFAMELAALQSQVAASSVAGAPAPAAKYIEVKGPGQALTNGTLGNFTITYKGMLVVLADGKWVFSGSMEFYDVWDFDPKPFGTSGRSTAGEVKTRVASTFLPGKPFEIFSVAVPCFQSGSDPRAIWSGGKPQFVPDQSGRTGADIGTGDVAGGVLGGGDVAAGDVGADTGAQAAEDLNP